MNGGQGPTFRDVMGLALPIAGLTVGLVRPQAGQQFSTLAQLMEMDQRRKERQAEQEREQAAQQALVGQLSPLGFKADPRLSTTTMLGLANVQAAEARLRAEREREQAAQQALAGQLSPLGFQTDSRLPASTQIGLANVQASLAQRKAEHERKNVEESRKARERQGFSEMARIGAASTELPDVNVEQLQALPGKFEFTPEMFQAQERALGRQEERGSRLAKARALEPQFGQTRDVSLAPPPPLREKLEIPATSPFSDRPVIEAAAQGAQLVEPLPPPAPLSIREVPENVHALQRYIMQTGKEPTPEEARLRFGVAPEAFPGGAEAETKRLQADATLRHTNAQITALEAKGVVLAPESRQALLKADTAFFAGRLSPADYRAQVSAIIRDPVEARQWVGQAFEERGRQETRRQTEERMGREEGRFERALANDEFGHAARVISAVSQQADDLRKRTEPIALAGLEEKQRNELLEEFAYVQERLARLTGAFMRSRAPEDLKKAYFGSSTLPKEPLPNTPLRR